LLWSEDKNKNCDSAQLELFQTLLLSYKHKLQSTSHENDTLYNLLRQARAYAEDLLNEREKLVQAVEEMEQDVSQHKDQQLLLKVIMLFSLLVYLSGGSPGFLIAAVGLQLLATFINLII
jgi:arsenate reductase-like glutaredoxin family protein